MPCCKVEANLAKSRGTGPAYKSVSPAYQLGRKSGADNGPPRTPPVKFEPLGRFGSTTHGWKVLAYGYNFSKPNVA